MNRESRNYNFETFTSRSKYPRYPFARALTRVNDHFTRVITNDAMVTQIYIYTCSARAMSLHSHQAQVCTATAENAQLIASLKAMKNAGQARACQPCSLCLRRPDSVSFNQHVVHNNALPAGCWSAVRVSSAVKTRLPETDTGELYTL